MSDTNNLISKIFAVEGEPDTKKMMTFVNLYTYGVLRKQSGCLVNIDTFGLDASSMVLLLRMLGHRVKRKSFDMTSVGAQVLSEANRTGKSLYFLGGEAGIAQKAVNVLRQSFADLDIAGTGSGYFKDARDRTIQINDIVKKAPDIIIVGMGAGHQEQMLSDLRSAGYLGQGFTCGGFLHQTAMGNVNYYPAWINRLNLRWLYRCIREPNVIKRLVIDYPKNSVLLLLDFWAWKRESHKP